MLLKMKTLALLGIAAMSLSISNLKCTTNGQPPQADIQPRVDTVLGREMVDNYYWLRDRGDPKVIEYLEAENAYTEAIMKHTEKLQEELFQEMRARIKETDLTVPVKKDDYYYYSRMEEGKQYPIYCRKHGSLESEEEILLDVNQLAEGKQFMSLRVYRVSPDHKLLAYAYDSTGNERFHLKIKNFETGEHLEDRLESISRSVEWANDCRTIFYAVPDEAWRTYKLFRHRLGSSQEDDELVFHEPDEAFWLTISKTKSHGYLLLRLASISSSEYYYLDADQPDGTFRLFQARRPDIRYKIDHHHDQFYIMSNENAENYKLLKCPVKAISSKNRVEVIPHSAAVKIDDFELFADHLVVYEREGGLQRIRIVRLSDNKEHEIEFAEPVYCLSQNSNPEFESHLLRFTYESMITPETVYDYDMITRQREMKKQREVLGEYNFDDYRMERIFAPAHDGTMVPVSLVYKKGLQKNGAAPLYLSGYGAYGSSRDPYFSSNRLSLLDRGFVYAIAHVRGGGEMGRYWYDDGKLLKKKNTFTDFIACAVHLIDEKYTSADKLVIAGGSAGGLLIGAVLNMRPDLFHVAVADVPFVDVINTMRDESIPLTVIEYDEWGNPNDEKFFDYMLSYSPYDNVKAQAYPNILITAGLYDTRVQYWEPDKWIAKLRSMKTDNNRLLLKVNMGAGHGGASGRYDSLNELAFEFAFILDVLGMSD